MMTPRRVGRSRELDGSTRYVLGENDESSHLLINRDGKQVGSANPFLSPLRWVGFGHAMFLVLILVMFKDRWWTGSSTTDRCRGTMPHICWISECINEVWGRSPARELIADGPASEKIVFQSRIWFGVSLVPALSSCWLVFANPRKPGPLDVHLAILSVTYMLVGLVPDLLPQPWHSVHLFISGIGIVGGFMFQFLMGRQGVRVTLPFYIFVYFGLSEALVNRGVSRGLVYDWRAVIGFGQPLLGKNSYVREVLEWCGVFGASWTALAYCVLEDCRVNLETKTWESVSPSERGSRANV
eukprot:TRINITY_DN71242_c0_g1_i1.p1 TRINITY_DN71242_c0_g1~~TRINITY_DN71242_c0_g1_i1.p1  ORF type:complete len:298 (+),score=32.61 TRINITY_DN71242_c0_g1_i1:16-909(+)